jgi:RND family efflux transporter, MFP subunit
MTESSANPPSTAAPANGKRRVVGLTLLVIVLLAGVAWAIWWFIVGRWHATTEDAYVQGDMVMLTPQQAGTVTQLTVANTQYVQRGQLIARLDDTDAQVALAKAEAQLAQTARQVAQLYQQVDADRAAVALRAADRHKAGQDLARARKLAPTHGVSRAQLDHAEAAVRSSQAALDQARHTLAAAEALTQGVPARQQPQVKLAEAQLRQAWVGLARTRIVAPVSGFVARKTVQLGQQVSPSSPLLAIVPLDEVYVDANFKETDLGALRLNQPVTLTSDLYGSDVVFHGRVVGFSAGTGSAFSVLPPQNASGNWIKVVQRLPVRIALKPDELEKHPLALGLSMDVDIDLHDESGPRLSKKPLWNGAMKTAVYADQTQGAEAKIRAILDANLPAGDTAGAAPDSTH